MIIRAATRGSALALWQTNRVAEFICKIDPDAKVVPVVVSTSGDRDKSTPIHRIGGKGVFVKEVQAAVLDGRADIAVHSAKDLPAVTPDGLTIAATPERADVRDALVGSTLEALPERALVGTGSVRRRVQLAEIRPDLRWVELRGNIDTRLSRVGELDAIVMAAAALDRLGRQPDVVDRLDPQVMVPQVAQGALAVECSSDDTETLEFVGRIEVSEIRRIVDSERSFLAELGGDCSLPAGALAVDNGEHISLTAILAPDSALDADVPTVERASGRDADGVRLGVELARALRARIDG